MDMTILYFAGLLVVSIAIGKLVLMAVESHFDKHDIFKEPK